MILRLDCFEDGKFIIIFYFYFLLKDKKDYGWMDFGVVKVYGYIFKDGRNMVLYI